MVVRTTVTVTTMTTVTENYIPSKHRPESLTHVNLFHLTATLN